MSQLGTRVPAQDYDQIRRQCLASHKLFEDPYFPADDASLFFSQKLPFKPEWKRPKVSSRRNRMATKCKVLVLAILPDLLAILPELIL